METVLDTSVVLDQAEQPRYSSGITPAQLEAAAKVVSEHRAHEVRRLRSVVPPPQEAQGQAQGS